MGVESYSIDPDSNGPGGYMPEGQFPSTVNNGVRAVQADLATIYNDPGWYRPGAPARVCTYLSSNSFRDPGGNFISLYLEGRRIRAVGALTGVIYGSVMSSAFVGGGNTDVQVNWDGSGLQSEPLTISLGTAPPGPTTWLPVAGIGHRGSVELATDAEAQDFTDPLRAVTPANLAALRATATDALNGISTERVLTPASIGGLTIRANPGAIRYPGDLLIQFGSAVTNGASFITVTYPALFTTFAAPVCTTLSATENFMIMIASSTVSGFTAVVRNITGAGSGAGFIVTWVSIGY